MTSVSGTRSDATSASRTQQARTSQQGNQAGAKPEDLRAMSDAFAAARAKMKLDPFAAKAGGRQQSQVRVPMQGDARASTETASALADAFERAGADRRQSEKFADGQGFGMGGQAMASPQPPVQLPNMPAPHVDPSSFAQMLADLWTRENGRGSKEVRVRFGDDAWPATGALLMQSADGLLDVTVDMAGTSASADIGALQRALTASGLTIGRVTTA